MAKHAKQRLSHGMKTLLAVAFSVVLTALLVGGVVILLFNSGYLVLNTPSKTDGSDPVPDNASLEDPVSKEMEPAAEPADAPENDTETHDEDPEEPAPSAILDAALALAAEGRYSEAAAMIASEPGYAEDPALSACYETCLEKEALLEMTVSEASTLAAGYDCAAACELLRSFEGWSQIPVIVEKINEFEAYEAELKPYQNMSGISHVFFHSLIVDTARAFDGDGNQDGYNLYMTTCDEFRDILEDLYERGYVLVTPYQVAGEELRSDGTTRFAYREIFLPEGKKPIMMSQDDVNYYGYMIGAADGSNEIPVYASVKGDGFASRIVIGEDGYPTCEYMDAAGNILYGEYDLVPILENFIRLHPDFSYRGARAVLGVTAYEGVFGYRTKPTYEPFLGAEVYKRECDDAKAVVAVLKEKGWVIASHTYGHPALGNATVDKVRSDTEKFRNTAKCIIGETDILIYPHGSDIAGVEKYSMSNEKFAILYEDGFRYFFNVDNCVAWHQMGDHYFRGNRRDLDGFRMYHYPDSMNDIIDARDVLDDARPLPVPDL